ncbi:hypothetical protein EPA93_43200 [Ktedonosporobacter rubrisoli]|uniref:Histidine kinase/HSP90-like ATPase domain-containing protein n=1 Tax=Ktedonosporobacter rubrisoli TaxID=2509675 RepID=A0A4P6K3D9_KTERU|nr:histidine kinase [Ktedonosporobacter rubrisoli]QBD82423.1 hypothetical protein EPA93_43200 [Ktedonosporobacter rubrisoli]
MKSTPLSRALRWLFLFWIGVVYIWGVWGITTVSGIYQGRPALFIQQGLKIDSSNLLHIGIFTPLLLLYGVLLWIGLSGRISSRFAWLYFLLEGGIALACSLILHQMNVALSLYLTLTLAAIVILKQPGKVLHVAIGSILLLLLALFTEISPLLNKANTSAFYWEAVSGLLPSYLATALFVVGYLLLYRQHMQAAKQLSLAYDELATAHLRLRFSTEHIVQLSRIAERESVARDLHDTLAQQLAGLLMQLEAIQAGLISRRYAEVLEMVEQSLPEARLALIDVRGTIADLRNDEISPKTLAQKVQQEMERLNGGAWSSCHVELAALAHVPTALCEQVRCVISEGLTNIARHALAKKVWITTSLVAGVLEITIGDDGIGFANAPETISAGHYGLIGMRERAHLLGGELIIDSVPGKGTKIHLCIPIDEGERRNRKPQSTPAEALTEAAISAHMDEPSFMSRWFGADLLPNRKEST